MVVAANVTPEVTADSLPSLNAEQLRALASDLIAQIASLGQSITRKDREILYRGAKIDQLTHEIAVLKRMQFGKSREQLDAGQASLLEETIEADIAAIEQELQNLAPAGKTDKETANKPKRAALPAELPRVAVHHEPDATTCGCGCQLKRIGEDISEKLDYTPGAIGGSSDRVRGEPSSASSALGVRSRKCSQCQSGGKLCADCRSAGRFRVAARASAGTGLRVSVVLSR